jgi:hypothetical protein
MSRNPSFQWLCSQYFASAEFKLLESTTRKRRRSILDSVCCEQASEDNPKLIGVLPFATIPSRAVRRLRDRKAELPEAANGRLKALKAMFRWAVEADYMEVNPAKDVPRIRTTKVSTHGQSKKSGSLRSNIQLEPCRALHLPSYSTPASAAPTSFSSAVSM